MSLPFSGVEVQKNGEKLLLYLTNTEIESKRGKELRAYLDDAFYDDICGHGAIRWYYDLEERQGKNIEITDFSMPVNFPIEVAEAIKAGKFSSVWFHDLYNLYQLLTDTAQAEYDSVHQTARAEYDRIKRAVLAEYNRIERRAWVKYDRVWEQGFAYDSVRQQAFAEYKRVWQSAQEEYECIEQQAWIKYRRIKNATFWRVFTDIENRIKLWR